VISRAAYDKFRGENTEIDRKAIPLSSKAFNKIQDREQGDFMAVP
jgi:hypothetical protein